LNILSFVLFAVDKFKARNNYYRINENYLFLLFLCGGWLGGYISMILFNHKLKKLSFVFKAIFMTFCNIIVLNIIYKFYLKNI